MGRLMDSVANGWQRIGASILDFVICCIIFIPFIIWVQKPEVGYNGEIILSKNAMVQLVIFGLIMNLTFQFIIPLLLMGKTIGKAIVGLRMVDGSGKYASGGQLFVRSLIYTIVPLLTYIPLLGILVEFGGFIIFVISLIFIFSDQYHQAVHDKISGVFVIEDYKYYYGKRKQLSDIDMG